MLDKMSAQLQADDDTNFKTETKRDRVKPIRDSEQRIDQNSSMRSLPKDLNRIYGKHTELSRLNRTVIPSPVKSKAQSSRYLL